MQIVWNFKKMMGYGLFFVLNGSLRKLYSKDEMKEVIRRYNVYFNTHPFMASFVCGAVLKYEEEYAKSKDDAILTMVDNIKLRFMGPLAAIGDAFFWGALKPFVVVAMALFIYVEENSSIAIYGLAILFLFYNFFHFMFLVYGFNAGYKNGISMINVLKKLDLPKRVEFIRKAGSLFIGAFWAFNMVLSFSKNLKLGVILLLVSVFITLVFRKISNLLIFLIILVVYMLGGLL